MKVGLRSGLPALHLVDREATLDQIRETGSLEQLGGDLRRTVRERRHADACGSELAHSFFHVRMEFELAEPGEDVLGSSVGRTPQRLDLSEATAQDAEPNRAKVRVGARGGEGKPVAQRAREPDLEQLTGRAHVLEASAQRLQVGQRLVDIEEDDGRTGHRCASVWSVDSWG